MNFSGHWVVVLCTSLFSAASVVAANAEPARALVRRAPSINGTIEGSLQLLLGENVALNGEARITGDLFVPGTPSVRLNGRPSYAGTIDGAGSAAPSNYRVTLSGEAALRQVVRRTDPVVLPLVATPVEPLGTRSVTLNRSGQTAGDFSTLRNLTVAGDAGQFALPPGRYGNITVNGSGGLTLGVAGAAQPAVYDFQRLTLSGEARLRVLGPVAVTVRDDVTLSGDVGSTNSPSWLTLNISTGNLTLNGESHLYGYVTAPNGTVTIAGESRLWGGVACDRLALNGEGALHLIAREPNQSPQVSLTSPPAGAAFIAPAAFNLNATAVDPDGRVVRVEFYRGATIVGQSTAAPFSFSVTNLAPGIYSFTARAIDDQGASKDSSAVVVTVLGNQAPTVAIVAPADGDRLIAPASVTISANAVDADGVIGRVEFFVGATKIGEDLFAPYSATLGGLSPGRYVLTARAFDQLGASTVSPPVTVTVDAPNQSPLVQLIAPVNGSEFFAPASLSLVASASDFDGAIARVEFYSGDSKIGERTTTPYELNLIGLAAGRYAFTARAYDNNDAATTSTIVHVTITAPNQAPVVSLTSPTDGAVFITPATLVLSATASDPDGVVTKVEFFDGVTKLGEVAIAPFEFIWTNVLPGSRLLTARAYDDKGAVATSAVRRVTVSIGLPYFTGFETADGNVLGPVDGQAGWASSAGATVADTLTYRGAQALLLSEGSAPVQTTLVYPRNAMQTKRFTDFFGRLVAGASAISGTFVRTDAAGISLVRTGTDGEINVFNGDGSGGGSWQATGFKVALTPDGRATTWLRLTLREDADVHRWDLYADGRLVACDLGFTQNSGAAFSSFAFVGQGSGPSAFDDLYLGMANPLFVDADRDGMDDAWETAHGLDSSFNDRDGDLDGDGVSNIREFLFGLRPDKASTFDDGISDGQRVSQHLSLTGPTSDLTPPAPPSGLVASFANSMVDLAWLAATDDLGVAGYRVYRSGQLLNLEAVGETAYVDYYPPDGTTQEYVVRAVDFAGNLSPPSNSSFVSVPLRDSDGNGMPDEWQIRYFGHVGVAPDADEDGDGIGNLQEFKNGSDPTDFYNAVLPTLTAPYGEFLSPEGTLDLRVTKPDGAPWANAPVTFRITSGYNRLSPTPGGMAFQTEVHVRGDSSGLARAYLEVQP